MKKTVLATPNLKVELLADGGISITGIEYFGQPLFEGQAPLTEVTCVRMDGLKEEKFLTADSCHGWQQAEIVENSCGAVMVLGGHPLFPALQIVITAKLDQEKSAISWTGAVTAAPDDMTVRELAYPRLTADVGEKKNLLYAEGPGRIFSITPETEVSEEQEEELYGGYPSWNPSMQFMALYDDKVKGGIYYGTHDPDAAYKRFYFKAQPGKPVYLEVGYPAEGYGDAANTFALADRAVWQAFKGDWYDAACIYKNFVWTEARWVPEVDEKGILKNKKWANTVPHWWKTYSTSEEFLPLLLEAHKDLGIPSAVHLYAWFNHPFNNDFPHYFPTRPFVPEAIKTMQENGLKVMPYINGWLWDTHDRDCEDYQYTAIAKPAAMKNVDGSDVLKRYGKESNGDPCMLARMCSTTTVWKQKMADNCRRMVEELGVDGVYLDQIASGGPRFCCDKRHNHRPGGGKWWVESFNNLIEGCNAATQPETCLTSESNAEPYLKGLQGLLTWTNMFSDQVPAFGVVYGGYNCFGRCYNSLQEPVGDEKRFVPKENTDVGVRIISAQALVFGEQLGWIRPEMYLSTNSREFYKKIVHVRWDYNDYFVDGELLRPPFVPMEMSVGAELGYLGGFTYINERPIVTGLWRNKVTGKILLIAANITNEKQQTTMESAYFAGGRMDISLEPQQVYTEILE